VLDLHMPGISGFEVQARLKACNCGVPVIVITGHDTASAQVRAMSGGAFGFLRKPADGDLVVSMIERAIAAGAG
jgi:FixJ family two-component response regulator